MSCMTNLTFRIISNFTAPKLPQSQDGAGRFARWRFEYRARQWILWRSISPILVSTSLGIRDMLSYRHSIRIYVLVHDRRYCDGTTREIRPVLLTIESA